MTRRPPLQRGGGGGGGAGHHPRPPRAERAVAPEGTEVEKVVAKELAALADAPVDNTPKVWKNTTPTGMLLRNSDALSSATPRHILIERYLKQHNNQDFVLNLEDTHPSIASPSAAGHYTARKSGLCFFEAHSSSMIPALWPQKLSTIIVECINPEKKTLPACTRAHSTNMRRNGATRGRPGLGEGHGQRLRRPAPWPFIHQASIIISIVPGMWVQSRRAPRSSPCSSCGVCVGVRAQGNPRGPRNGDGFPPQDPP